MIVSNWDKERLLRSTILAGFLAAGLGFSPAFAQEAEDEDQDAPVVVEDDEDEEEGAGEQERIVVTGSRISRNEFTSISPVQVVTGEVSRDLGLVNADDILDQFTVIQGQQTDLGVSTVVQPTEAFTTFGAVTPSLRGLASSITGRSRNLVLVNSRRYGPIGVGGAPANPDVSLIPGSLIERVEVLLDGASSIYGSDAIAGVINYILRDDIDGLEVDVFRTQSQFVGDDRSMVISAATGVQGDRGSWTAAFEYNKQNAVTRADRRRINESDQLPDGLLCDPELEINENTGEIFRGCSSFLADFITFGSEGTIVVTPGTTNFGFPGFSRLAGPPFNDPTTFGDINQPLTRSFPQDQLATVIPDTERYTFYVTGEYDLDLYTAPQAYFEFNYSERDLQTVAFNQGVIDFTEDTFGNPGFSDGIIVNLLEETVDQNIAVVRGVTGLRGELPFLDGAFGSSLSNWTYDTSLLYHRSRGTQAIFGRPRTDNVAAVLLGSVDANGTFQCDLRDQPGTGSFFDVPTVCPPVNFFDPQFITTGRFADQASNDFIFANALQTTLVNQFTFQGFTSGDLYDIPFGGTVSAAIGWEYRLDQIETVNDGLVATPNSFTSGNTDVGSNGERNIWEGFLELSIPLIENKPFVDRFQIDVATRYTEEQFFGAAWTYQIKGEYAPVDYFSVAAGFGTSFRAPDTGEQFGTGTTFQAFTRQDPCLPSTNTLETADGTNNPPGVPDGVVFYDATQDERQQSVIDLCEQLGVQLPTGPLDVAGASALGLFGLGTPSGSFQNFSVLFANGGSTTVNPETSEAFFAKATLQQPWFDMFDLSLSINYFEYEVEDSIGQLSSGLILGNCFNDPNAVVVNGVIQGDLCQFQERDPNTGLLTFVNEASFNLGVLTSRGIDYNAQFNMNLADLPQLGQYMSPMGDDLRLGVTFRATQSLENAEDVSGNGVFNDNLGEFGFPELQYNITNQLSWGDFTVLHRYQYREATDNGLNPFGGGNVCVPALNARGEDSSGCTEYIDLPNVSLHDLTAVYQHDTWRIRGGVQNLMNTVVVRDVAIPSDGETGTPFGLGYSLNGRTFFMNISKVF